jgi:hypothetical protein
MSKTITRSATALEEPPVEPGALIERGLEQAALALDDTARRYTEALSKARETPFRRALLLAEGIDALRRSIKPEFMRKIMALVGSPLGIGSDRGPGRGKGGQDTSQYDEATVREAFIQSLLLGFYPVGNEWMIYRGRFFGCKSGWRRKLEEVPGISDIKCASGIPLLHNGRQVVRVAISWRLNGIRGELIGTDGKPGIGVAPTTFGGESASQLAGKAEAKAYHIAYEQVTGSKQTVMEEELEVVETPPALPAGSGSNGPPTQRLTGPEFEALLKDNQGLANNLDMDQAAVNALAEQLNANLQTVEGQRLLNGELRRRAGPESGMAGDEGEAD